MKKIKTRNEEDIFELITIQPFGYYLLFCYLDSEDSIKDYLNKKKNKKISDWLRKHTESLNTVECVGCVFKKSDDRPLILFLKKNKDKSELLETIIHETNHLVKAYSNYCCFKEEFEFNAYLQQYVSGLIIKRLNIIIR